MGDAFTELDTQGYTILEGLLTPRQLAEIRTVTDDLFRREGPQAGAEFRQEPGAARLANLVNKSPAYWPLIESPRVLDCVRRVLGCRLKLSSLNARTALAGNGSSQPLHCDMGALPDAQGFWVCNAVWLLDAFTSQNGAIRVVPGSHTWKSLPEDALPNPLASHPQEQVVTAPAGSVVVVNAHLWHGGLANNTSQDRRALHAFYCRRDKPQQQVQRELIAPEIQSQLSPALRDLLALDEPFSGKPARHSGFLE